MNQRRATRHCRASTPTYLPDDIRKIHYALTNSVIISVTVTVLTLTFAALSAYTVALAPALGRVADECERVRPFCRSSC